MARNDIVLLDSVLGKEGRKYGSNLDKSEMFEFFCFDQILKDYDLSFEEIEQGWVDGKDDGGIDGAFIFIDEVFVSSKIDPKNVRKEPKIELWIITCKYKDSFKLEPVNGLISTIPELFDLGKDEDSLISDINEEVLKFRENFRLNYIDLIDKSPRLSINFVYACRGNEDEIGDNIKRRSEYLIDVTKALFSDVDVRFEFAGASRLLELFRVKKQFSLRLKFIEGNISREKTNYILLSRLDDYYRFIVDDAGKLRRYLFESNVRDYLGNSGINQDIEETLSSGETKSEFDFWWLNNGITILSSSANIAGKEISLENIQIVNGLQTTETLYKHFSKISEIHDDRAVLIKIIVASDDSVRDRIIKATNNQNPVELSSLRATDKVQRDIEHILMDYGWYYDRRKNFYKNQGIESDKIVSMAYVYASVYALCLGKVSIASKPRSRFMRDEDQYNKVFDTSWKIEVFAACVVILKRIEALLKNFNFGISQNNNTIVRQYKYLMARVCCCILLKKQNYHPNELASILQSEITKESIEQAWGIVSLGKKRFFDSLGSSATLVKKPHRNQPFHDAVSFQLSEYLKGKNIN